MQFMSKLNIGDKIELMMTDGVLKTYVISQLEVSEKPELGIKHEVINDDSLFLTTCWPFNDTKLSTKRYIILAHKIKNNQIIYS